MTHAPRAAAAAATVPALRRLYARTASIRGLAAAVGRAKSTVHAWLVRHQLPRRRRGLAGPVERKLRQELARPHLMSLRKIAALVGCGKSTVARRLDAAAGKTSIKRCRKWRCPGCGALLVVKRCLACRIDKQ